MAASVVNLVMASLNMGLFPVPSRVPSHLQLLQILCWNLEGLPLHIGHTLLWGDYTRVAMFLASVGILVFDDFLNLHVRFRGGEFY